MSLQKYVKVELGGKERLLKFDYNSVSDLEEHYGKGIASILNEEQFGFNTARVFYTYGLRWKEPGMTTQVVGNLLGEEVQNGKDLKDLFEPVMKALTKSKLLGDVSESEDDEVEINEEDAKN
jgi:hypothetical protein